MNPVEGSIATSAPCAGFRSAPAEAERQSASRTPFLRTRSASSWSLGSSVVKIANPRELKSTSEMSRERISRT